MKVMATVVPLAGHVGPVSGLVAELINRGHQVRVYTGSRYGQRFADLGATVVPWSNAQDFDEENLGATFPLARRRGLTVIALVRQGFIGTAPGQVQDLSAELDREPADVLVADSMSFGGVLTGEVRGIPWALMNVLPFNQDLESPAPPGLWVASSGHGARGRMRNRLLWLLYRVVTFPFNRAYNRARTRIGLPRDRRPYGSVLMSKWLVLATGCASLDGQGLNLPDTGHFVGRLEPAGAARSNAHVDSGSVRPLVVVTQGTAEVDPDDLIQPALAGLAELAVDVIATSGRRDRTEVGAVPPANARVVDLLDFASVLPKAAVFVTNGGWGGVLASLAAGVPVVIAAGRVPDKSVIAARVSRAGVGIDLGKGRPKPSAVANAVREVLSDPRYAGRARQVAAELDQLGGPSAAADLLERLAETRAPVRRVGNP